jgi:hypothetical protein
LEITVNTCRKLEDPSGIGKDHALTPVGRAAAPHRISKRVILGKSYGHPGRYLREYSSMQENLLIKDRLVQKNIRQNKYLQIESSMVDPVTRPEQAMGNDFLRPECSSTLNSGSRRSLFPMVPIGEFRRGVYCEYSSVLAKFASYLDESSVFNRMRV